MPTFQPPRSEFIRQVVRSSRRTCSDWGPRNHVPDRLLQQVEEPVTAFDVDPDDEVLIEPRWIVLVHNDDVTPFDYVVRLLLRVFLLSYEMAEHVAETAHTEGQAIVVVRPRAEARQLVTVATAHARGDGYPLHFTAEPEE